MSKSYNELILGHREFKRKLKANSSTLMQDLANHGQHPEVMVVACADSRVDPALLLQCDPGDIFVARNVANMIPPYDNSRIDSMSAALEYAVCYLKIKDLIILGHSCCGGISALTNPSSLNQDDFISQWVSLSGVAPQSSSVEEVAHASLHVSYQNCLTFPWMQERVEHNTLRIHRWYFEIAQANILAYNSSKKAFLPLVDD